MSEINAMNNESDAVTPTENDKTVVHYGTPVVPGVAWAPAVWTRRPLPEPETAPDLAPQERERASKDFTAATQTVADDLFAQAERVPGYASEVLMVTASLATDKAWRKDAVQRIDRGVPPVQATIAAIEKFIDLFEKAGGIMAERTTDLRDVRDRVIARLQGREKPGIPDVSGPSIILADDLSPADTATLNPKIHLAIVTEFGGPTSHTSIIARQMGIPCIVAARTISSIPAGTTILVDGSQGIISEGVDDEVAQREIAEDAERRASVKSWKGPGQTSDGVPVKLLANVQDGNSAKSAAEASPAEGIGLFRTELVFLNTKTKPSIEDQTHLYSEVISAFPSERVVVRTLDSGSDKPVPFAPLLEEANPALGVRGIRTTGHDKDLLLQQLDAIVLAAKENPEAHVWVMAPMVSTLSEAQWFADLVHERDLTAGIMIEVPSAAILIDEFLNYVDFVSIGTNDLTQYVMAADRMSPDLAEYTDPWQPAVLRLIAHVAHAGVQRNKPIGICGEAAADPLLACALVGMGVTSLSMAAPSIAAVGAQLSSVTMKQCQDAAEALKGSHDAGDARNRVREALS